MRWLKEWFDDWRWAADVRCARRLRRGFGFLEKRTFDDVLRPAPWCSPETLYEITGDDVARAAVAAALFPGARDARQRAEEAIKADLEGRCAPWMLGPFA